MRFVSQSVDLDNIDVLKFDVETATIPSISQQEINILRKVSTNKRLKFYARCYEGEINLTFHKRFLKSQSTGYAKMIKGAAVQRWLIREKMSQGEIQYLDNKMYLKENSGAKSTHHKLSRIVMQGITGVDEKTRLKMTLVEPGVFCGNSVNYILIEGTGLEYKFLLGLLNSTILNWYFKVFSTNSNVNGYEVDNFPIPDISQLNQKPISGLVDQILTAKQANPQADTRAWEAEIDRLVYALYGLTPAEIAIVEGRA